MSAETFMKYVVELDGALYGSFVSVQQVSDWIRSVGRQAIIRPLCEPFGTTERTAQSANEGLRKEESR